MLVSPPVNLAKFPSLKDLPYLTFETPFAALENDECCYALWRKYKMPENIAAHSRLVAFIAEAIAKRAQNLGIPINPDLVRQSGLLHDLGKAYSLAYGGGHAMLGAAWVVAETGNLALAQGVLHHVNWPWDLPQGSAICSLPLIVLYADKRAKHDECVTLEERASDLLERYGLNPQVRLAMQESFAQVRQIEQALSSCLHWEDLNADTFNLRGMVH
ncbi:MAG: HDIG domain-containing protein [Desulfovibrionaceae bacterium]|nr:HDIG domain-containing protein [Desulfovibrionaceae bacterium]